MQRRQHRRRRRVRLKAQKVSLPTILVATPNSRSMSFIRPLLVFTCWSKLEPVAALPAR